MIGGRRGGQAGLGEGDRAVGAGQGRVQNTSVTGLDLSWTAGGGC